MTWASEPRAAPASYVFADRRLLPQSAIALAFPHLSEMAVNLLKVFIESAGISISWQQEDQPAANKRGTADDECEAQMI